MSITAKEDSPDFKGGLAWLQKPEIVCRGAKITDIYAKNNLSITADGFETSDSKTILLKYIKQLLSATEWQPYQTQTAVYTMSYLSYLIGKTDKSLDFNQILDIQSVPKELDNIVIIISRAINKFITTPKDGVNKKTAGMR
jgi:AIPR protein